MFDFIPLPFYTGLYYHLLFVLACIVLLQSFAADIRDPQVRQMGMVVGALMLMWVVLYMGLRPVSGIYFGDMATYNNTFLRIKAGENISFKKDVVFNNFVAWSAKVMSASNFFLLVAALYIVPCYVFARKYCGSYWFFLLFMLMGSFSFWSYGTNGIRNGWATSTFILALVFYDKKMVMYALMFLAYGIHNSMMIPIAAFVVSGVYKNPKIYLYIWLAAIPLSLVGSGFFQSAFAGLVGDDRATDYLTKGNVNNDAFSSTGFRWDFVLYSGFAVFAGWYFIFKKKITDRFYIHLWGTYMIANAFWILVIKANFSNRFAYLSWFLMAAVIGYPIFRYKMWQDQYRIAAGIIFLYYGFSYFMFLKS